MKDDMPSATAILIAKSLVFIAGDRRYRSVMPAGMAELSRAFLRAVMAPWRIAILEALGRTALARSIVRALERRSVPGMIGHYIVRKRCLQEIVEEATHRFGGLEQLVIFGAGLDTLGTRIAKERPGLRVYELDHPATSHAKRRAFAEGHATLPPNLSLMAVDLAKIDPRVVLREAGTFSFAAKTLFIAEGVFMYLPLADVGRALDIMREFPAGHASFAFTYMLPSDDDGRPAFAGQSRGVDRWLGRKREPFVWGATPASLSEFVSKRGFRSVSHTGADQLRQACLVTTDARTIATAVGENIAWVES